jgi:hypothetical protein
MPKIVKCLKLMSASGGSILLKEKSKVYYFAHDLCHSQVEYLSNSTRREPQGQMTGSND